MKKKISLADWIRSVGIDSIVEALGTNESAVRHWRNGRSLPKSVHMFHISKLSKNQISWDLEVKRFFEARK